MIDVEGLPEVDTYVLTVPKNTTDAECTAYAEYWDDRMPGKTLLILREDHALEPLRSIGMRELNSIIRTVLDRHYPEDLFGKPDDLQYGVTWRADLDHGPGLDPGVKWACLLRMALDEVRPKEEK